MDIFAAAVQRERAAGVRRDQLIARVMRDVPAIPCTSQPQQYVTGADMPARLAQQEKYADACKALVRRHRVNTLRRHSDHLVTAYWGDHTEAVRDTLLNRDDQYRREEVQEGYAYNVTRSLLTRQARDIIRAVRDHEVRAQYASEVNALINPDADADVTPTSNRPWRGLVNGAEVRVNVRGAYGKRSIKGTAARVSQRDNYVPTFILKPLALCVGVATHPDADASDYDALLQMIRKAPMQATYRRYADASDVTGTVCPVHVADASDGRTEASKAKSVSPVTRAQRDVTRQMMMPTIHA